MPRPNIGSAVVVGVPTDVFRLELSRSAGAVVAIAFTLSTVPPAAMSSNSWIEADFLAANPQIHNLPALFSGRYELAVVVSVPPPTQVEIELFKNGAVVYRRTVIGVNAIRNISLRIK